MACPANLLCVLHVMIRDSFKLQAEWSEHLPYFCAFPNSDGGELAGRAGVRYVGQAGAVLAASPSLLLSREPTMVPISSGFFVPSPFGLVPAPAFSFAAAAAGCLPPDAEYGEIAPPSPSKHIRDPAGMTHGTDGSHPTQTGGPPEHNSSSNQPPTAAASILVAGTYVNVKGGGTAGAEVDPPICQLHNVALVVAPGRESLPATVSYQDGYLAPAAAPVPVYACYLGVSDSAQDDDGEPAASVCPYPENTSGLDTAACWEQDDDSAARDCGTGSDSGGGFGVFDFDGDGVDWLGFLVTGEGVVGAAGGS